MSVTPRPPSHETNTPTAIATSDFQFTKEWMSVEGGSVPLAIGAMTPMVRMIIPTVRPCFSIQGKKVFRGVTRTMISTRIETATVVLWLTKPRAASPRRISRVTSNIVVSLPKEK
ncbi:hypothetical protein HMPREF3212_03166 [Citrobacter freundii]|nr:hypothetical protein HMPREF3212_03166 [Citrobacter freundii]